MPARLFLFAALLGVIGISAALTVRGGSSDPAGPAPSHAAHTPEPGRNPELRMDAVTRAVERLMQAVRQIAARVEEALPPPPATEPPPQTAKPDRPSAEPPPGESPKQGPPSVPPAELRERAVRPPADEQEGASQGCVAERDLSPGRVQISVECEHRVAGEDGSVSISSSSVRVSSESR